MTLKRFRSVGDLKPAASYELPARCAETLSNPSVATVGETGG